ncbi:MAG: T9SS type A sorting domain-containing protein [Bacteroidota bacterium]
MKRFYNLLSIIVIVITTTIQTQAQIFNQDFSAGGTTSDYVSATPNSGQWNAISTSGAGTTVSISNNALVFTRTLANVGSFSRTTDFSPMPTGMVYQFVITVSGNTVAKTNAAVFQIGSGFGTTNVRQANADTYAWIGINLTVIDGTFQLRDISSSTSSSDLSGSQLVTWHLNNSGTPVTYTAPDGNPETVANDTYDLWAGTTKIFNDLGVVTSTQNMSDLKFVYDGANDSTVVGSIILDNFLIYGATDGSLPVQLTSFNANIIGNKVQLNWQTATEVSNYGFDIERAFVETQHAASLRWEKIGFVQGNGNSSSPKNYLFTDEPKEGKEFKYRLKQIDFDGSFEYSKETFVTLENLTRFVLEQNYPNPFNPVTKISYSIPQRVNVKLRVYDILAKEVAELVNNTQEAGRYEVTFDGSNLPSGVYFYKLEAGRFVEVRKLLLIK